MLEDNYPGYKLHRGFEARGKKFVFKLTKYDCYRIAKRKCSVVGVYDEITENAIRSECDLEYCQALLQSLKREGVVNKNYPIRIIKNSCGHYSIEDGQHRLCSAATAGLDVDVYIQESPYKCYICENRKHVFSRKIWNDTFLRKL
ncbi:ParB N-terminal domain-containing protein [Cellulosilyticum sp. ST5]|uniref:ParB N-terminal domain-containing protein n=1 Tax=Cellulosilyticum sp. ST5 TaxID=3055805 RepID=UPI003977565C